MNERDRRVVQQLRELGAFSEIFAHGITPDELKEALIAQLAPYSLNRQALTDYVVEYMVSDAISLGSIADHRWAMDLFTEALRVHREALDEDRAASLECLFRHMNRINDALSIYWSQYHLSRDIDALELEEFLHEALRLIGTIIEGPVKPLLYALVHQARIARGRLPKIEEVLALKLGNLVDELIQRAADPMHLSLGGVRLNQWRNIAQHISAHVEGQTIICEYNDGKVQIRLSRSELRQVVIDTLAAYKALKVARSVVFFDCIDEMRALGMVARSELRPAASLVVLVSGLASQGFEVVETQYTPAQSRVVVQDLSMLDPNERRIHSTQFVIPLFHARPADQVVVEYWERDGTPSLRTIASRALIERAQREGDWTIVAEEFQFTNLKAPP